jgi:hypothetical protein
MKLFYDKTESHRILTHASLLLYLTVSAVCNIATRKILVYNCIHVSSTIAIFSIYLNTEYFWIKKYYWLLKVELFKYRPLSLTYSVVTKYMIIKSVSKMSKYATDDFNSIL